MIKKKSFWLVHILFSLLIVGGCVKQQKAIVESANNLKALQFQVPKYRMSTVHTYWKLGLHPKDVVLDVRLSVEGLDYSRSAKFSYDRNYDMLGVTFRLGPPITISYEPVQMALGITVLQYYELRTHSHKRRVYCIAKMKRNMVASPEYDDIDEGIVIQDQFNKWNLEKWKYDQLYKELASLSPSEKKNLKESLKEEIIAKVTFEKLKAYLRTARFILSRL